MSLPSAGQQIQVSTAIPILQVEDDENDIFFLAHAFQRAGISNPLHVVRDGQEAVDYLLGIGEFADRARHPIPGLMLLDLKMPRKTGLEVLEWMAGEPEWRVLPVVVFSSSAHQDDVDRAYALGANAVVVKPPSVAERVAFARAIKEFWLDLNQLPEKRPPSNRR